MAGRRLAVPSPRFSAAEPCHDVVTARPSAAGEGTSDHGVMLPLVSVIVPVAGPLAGLGACLDALECQTYPRARYEVIVVDNGAEQSCREMIADRASVLQIQESRPGSYAARNAGLRVARGTVLAFTDADCAPATDWIEHGVRRIQASPDCGLLAGRIEVVPRDPARPSLVELYEVVLGFPQQSYVANGRFGATANLFTRREVMDAVGPFDPRLPSSGDLDWGRRVHEAGYRLAYADEVRVSHTARGRFAELRAKARRVALGARILWADQPGTYLRSILADLRLPLADVRMVLGHAGLRGPKARLGVIALHVSLRALRAWDKIRYVLPGLRDRDACARDLAP